jgi:hypothetical protein
LSTPAGARTDGPGYGGTADAVTVQWRADAGRDEGLAVYAFGFRGGSPVALRVGAAADRTIYADAAGRLRVLVVDQADRASAEPAPGLTVLAVDTGAVGQLSPGVSVQATGRDPAGAVRTLVGAVPPPPAGYGVQDVVPWVAALAVLVGIGWSARRAARRRLGPTLRRYQRPARHRVNAGADLSR